MSPAELEAERVRVWVANLKSCDSYNSRAATIVHIKKAEPKMLNAVLKKMEFTSVEVFINWLAE